MTFEAVNVEGAPVADGVEGLEVGWFHPERFPALSGYNRLLVDRVLARLTGE